MGPGQFASILTVPQTVRKPKLPSEWLLWYFGSKDIGVAHTLARTFFWSENVLWKEDLQQHPTTVYLGSKDSIINASQVRTYLEEIGQIVSSYAVGAETSMAHEKSDEHNGDLCVVWCEGLNHGQVFDLPEWRSRLESTIIHEAKRDS